MSETMMVSGPSESSKIGDALQMAPGFGFVSDVIIDQHFTERGRIGRLIACIAQNPRIVGIGIDENTAIMVDKHRRVEVLGVGAVYIVDGRNVTFSNVAEAEKDQVISVYDVKLHMLGQGDCYDLDSRQPHNGSSEDVEEAIMTGAAG